MLQSQLKQSCQWVGQMFLINLHIWERCFSDMYTIYIVAKSIYLQLLPTGPSLNPKAQIYQIYSLFQMADLPMFEVTGHVLWRLLFSWLLPIFSMVLLTWLESFDNLSSHLFTQWTFIGQLWLQERTRHSGFQYWLSGLAQGDPWRNSSPYWHHDKVRLESLIPLYLLHFAISLISTFFFSSPFTSELLFSSPPFWSFCRQVSHLTLSLCFTDSVSLCLPIFLQLRQPFLTQSLPLPPCVFLMLNKGVWIRTCRREILKPE